MPTLTCSELTTAYYLQKDMWKDSARNADYVAEVNAAKAIIENQTAKIELVNNANKTISARIYWSKFCNEDTTVGAPNYCVITGDQADSACKDYAIDQQVYKKFTIDEALYQTNNLNVAEVFADNMLKTRKVLDEKITQMMIASLDGFTSANLYTTTGIGCPGVASPANWATTFIPPTFWTPELMNYFQTVARINKFRSPFLLDGKNLNATIWKSMMNAGNADGSGANKMVSLMKYYEDLVNVEAISPGKTFMIDRGTVAFKSVATWAGKTATSPVIDADGRKKYSEASENIPGLVYDIYITEECSGKFTKHNVLVDANFGVFNGAESCDSATGVLEFKCGACPT